MLNRDEQTSEQSTGRRLDGEHSGEPLESSCDSPESSCEFSLDLLPSSFQASHQAPPEGSRIVVRAHGDSANEASKVSMDFLIFWDGAEVTYRFTKVDNSAGNGEGLIQRLDISGGELEWILSVVPASREAFVRKTMGDKFLEDIQGWAVEEEVEG